MIAAETQHRLRPQTVLRLTLVSMLVITPHVMHIPLWLFIMTLLFGVWRILISRYHWPLPGYGMRLVLPLAGLIAVYMHYGTLFGREAGIALLIAMLGLKLLEMKARRDVFVVIFLGFFLIITNFLFSQEIWLAAYMLMAVMLLISIMIDINHPHPLPIHTDVRFAAAILGYALPMAVVLFVLFPRAQGPLWGMPNEIYSRMGMSDHMSPGSFGQLTQTEDVAFRVEFHNAVPPAAQRYWRGPVFYYTDGTSWSAAPPGEKAYRTRDSDTLIQALGKKVRYTITLEPHHHRWMFALDAPLLIPGNSVLAHDLQLLANEPVNERIRYDVTSVLNYRTGPLDATEYERALQIPATGNPRAREFAMTLRATSAGDVEIAQRVLNHFREQSFFYTLSPPRIEGDFIDGFLFETRRGFCEYYASSFTWLMRAAGVPARVVTGYQGGEYNPVGNYLIVRQQDAHAWSEIWLQGKGWVRVDPTAAVAPERVERGFGAVFPAENRDTELPQSAILLQLWRGAKLGWDAFNNGWNKWVLNYGPQRQNSLLSTLGFTPPFLKDMLFTLLILMPLLLLLVAVRLFKQRNKTDPALAVYQRFCARLSRHGYTRAPAEGPLDYANRIGAQRPDLAPGIKSINELFIALRYGNKGSKEQLAALRREVRKFRL